MRGEFHTQSLEQRVEMKMLMAIVLIYNYVVNQKARKIGLIMTSSALALSPAEARGILVSVCPMHIFVENAFHLSSLQSKL